MKLPWKREARDLVGEQVAELIGRPLTPAEDAQMKAAGILFLPNELTFPPTVAANDWCAPSEVIYSMEQYLRPDSGRAEAVVPLMVQVPRDGVRHRTPGCGTWPKPPAPLPAPAPWPAPEPIYKDATAP